MDKNQKNLVNQFIIDEFPVRKVKNHKKKWERAIIIPQGYLRKDTKKYSISKFTIHDTINASIIAADIIQILSNVFGCDYEYSKTAVLKYFKEIRV